MFKFKKSGNNKEKKTKFFTRNKKNVENIIDEQQNFYSDQLSSNELFDNQNHINDYYDKPQYEEGEMVFSSDNYIEKNIHKEALYTKQDLKNFNLSENDVIKFFKNGSIYYKLKEPLNNTNEAKKIFKNGTKFSLSTLKNITEHDPFFKDVKHYKDFDIYSLLPEDEKINPILQHKIYELNRSLEQQLKNVEEYSINETEIESIINAQKNILETQMELQNKIYSLRQDYANSSVFFKITNLYFNTWNEDDIYFGYKLNDLSFDVYSTDKIVVISDNSITNQLLIDVLRGDETKTSGHIYKNLTREQKWIDVDDPDYDQYKIQSMDLNEEIFYGLTSPDYLSFGIRKKDNVGITLSKICRALSVQVEEEFKNKLITLMNFNEYLNHNVFELDDLNLEKFITICDILIGKKILLIKSICQGMSYNQKMELLRFLNNYFDAKKITVIYASDDYLEANLIASKIMLIKNGYIVAFENLNNILSKFNTINDYIVYTLRYSPTPNKSE